MHSHNMTNPNLVESFLFAGKATFTLVNEKSGNRFTYRVNTKPNRKGNGDVSFASVLTGPDNETCYSYAGLVLHTANGLDLRETDNSRIRADTISFQVLRAFVRILSTGRIPAGLQFWHQGKCGRCLHPLTVPESIESGFGPECIKHV